MWEVQARLTNARVISMQMDKTAGERGWGKKGTPRPDLRVLQ